LSYTRIVPDDCNITAIPLASCGPRAFKWTEAKGPAVKIKLSGRKPGRCSVRRSGT